MNSKRLYRILVAGVALLGVGVIVGAYVINSLLLKQSATLADQRKQLAVLDGRATALKQARADVERYKDLGAIAKSIVPQDKNQAQTIGEIVKLADANGVKLASFSFPSSTLGTKGVGLKDALSQLQKIPDIPGVYGLQIIVQSDNQSPVSYDNFIGFLAALEHNRRTAQVSSITVTPNSEKPALVSFSLTLQEYIKP